MRNDGFTCLEALIALIILLTVSSSATLFFRAAWRSTAECIERAGEIRRLATAERALRLACGRISPPWWEDGARTEEREGGFWVGRLDGIKAKGIEFRLDQEGGPLLSISCPVTGSRRLPLPAGSRLTAENRGLRVSIPPSRLLGSRGVTLVAYWSGRALTDEQ